jgi:hypothetical protein
MGLKYTKKPRGSTILQPQPNTPHHAPATMSSEKNDTPEKPESHLYLATSRAKQKERDKEREG